MRRHVDLIYTRSGLFFVFALLIACSTARNPQSVPKKVPYVTEYNTTTDTSQPRRPTPEAYNALRNMFFRYEESKGLGADIELNDREVLANQIIMEVKVKEYNEGLATPHLFNPSNHIFSVLEKIQASPLFALISKMPKGGVLHAHDTAMVSTDFLIQLTYRSSLWVCRDKSGEALDLKFAKQQPIGADINDCSWELLSKVREKLGDKAVDDYLRESLTLYPTEKFLDNNVAWQEFMKIFRLLDGLVFYAPCWSDYYYQVLTEFSNDGVQYLEFRTTLPVLYDMEGTNYTSIDTARIYKETLDKFTKSHPDFIGSKMIYAPLRNTESIEPYIKTLIEVKAKYPSFVAGFDLVGQEELGRPLRDFIPQLLSIPDNIDFYFHAGETNWYGSSVDENVMDAVLLGTKRIGHGFALVKHPAVLALIKERNIAIEVNPVSNQVLQLVADYRNHPCSHLFANNYPVVISSDDPSFWRAAPLSHDFYMAFLGIASAHADLRLLKKLALNSIQYSAMDSREQATAMEKWQKEWDSFINFVIHGESNAAHRGLETNKLD